MTIIKEDRVFICHDCQWEGKEEELEFEKVESCMGDDETEICPVCGSMNVVQQKRFVN
ncbi:MAG: hypothetical protein ACERKD_04795 [Prolixibacteraceae bacterium]